MKLKFTKMHGAGNDFVVIDATHAPLTFTTEQWRQLSHRHFGVGADQILVVEKSQTAGVDFRYRIYNSDGGEVEQCGNGARAFVKFVTDKGLTKKHSIKVETMSGIIEPQLQADGLVTVNMGIPLLTPSAIPFDTHKLDSLKIGEDTVWPLDIDDKQVWLSLVSMGNPHAVQIVKDCEFAPVLREGPLILHHPRFAKQVNAGFMQIVDRHQIKLRVFERGAGETLACGTGACAAAISGIRRGLLDSPVTVQTHGGVLSIAWGGIGQAVMMTGPAVSVFEGEIEIAQ